MKTSLLLSKTRLVFAVIKVGFKNARLLDNKLTVL